MLELSRFEMIVGKEGIEKLKNISIIIFGVGGVGSYAAEAIARSGVGEITLVDYDEVCITNINRQIHALKSSIGKRKVDIMKERIAEINSTINVKAVNIQYDSDSHNKIFDKKYDFVIDAIDMVSSKLLLAEWCYKNNIKIISSMGTGNKFHPEKLEISDIKKTSVCPLARVIRYELKKRGVKKLTVVYSKENPVKSDKGSHNCKKNCVCPSKGEHIDCTGKKSIPGSTSFVPPAAGMLIASYVVREILGIK